MSETTQPHTHTHTHAHAYNFCFHRKAHFCCLLNFFVPLRPVVNINLDHFLWLTHATTKTLLVPSSSSGSGSGLTRLNQQKVILGISTTNSITIYRYTHAYKQTNLPSKNTIQLANGPGLPEIGNEIVDIKWLFSGSFVWNKIHNEEKLLKTYGFWIACSLSRWIELESIFSGEE